jgi:hypothetical protein
VRSARRPAYQAAALVVVALLLVVGVSGCETTQHKAAAKQAESKRILEQRERKRQHKHHAKPGGKGTEKR